MSKKIKAEDLVFHFLNVGFGDTAVIELPPNTSGERLLGIVDCCDGEKTLKYVKQIKQVRANEGINIDGVEFICATHPHFDHISGINKLLKDPVTRPQEFWDSGFRHNSTTYQTILKTIYSEKIDMRRISSGMERYFGKVRITALAPSVSLRNRYATYGVDMNNASIVLRFEHGEKDAVTVESQRYVGIYEPEIERDASQAVVILGGDAEFDSWAHVSQEYPCIERTSAHEPLAKKMVNLLNCWAIKVAHHGSMHSTPLDVYERMSPSLAIISTVQEKSTKTLPWMQLERNLFPHLIATSALEESKTRILTTDGSYEKDKNLDYDREGTIVLVVSPGKKPRYTKLNDLADGEDSPPVSV
jgi:beta-lactamase superfamily II metal-dependent hydrolase